MSRRPQGFSKITVATYLGHDLVLKTLLDQEAPDTSWQDDHGRTPRWWVSHNGHGHIVRLLLGKTADLSHIAKDVSESLRVAT